jgi:flagellar basal body rod protein FlgG
LEQRKTFRDGDDVIVECENSTGMISSWKGLVRRGMMSSSNVRIVRGMMSSWKGLVVRGMMSSSNVRIVRE